MSNIKPSVFGPISEEPVLSPLRVLVVVCAYNEEKNIVIPVARAVAEGFDVLVVDDGSEDHTSEVAAELGARVLRNPERLGKAAALEKAIQYAKSQGYDAIIEIDADAIPIRGSIGRLYHHLLRPEVGGVSARQIPLGEGLAYKIDEVMWEILRLAKHLQQRLGREVHLGAVMYGVKLCHVKKIVGVINDDEFIGIMVTRDGKRNYFAEDCIVYFDASTSIKHIFTRRKRMILGHLQLGKSTAPSMNLDVLLMATFLAVIRKPSRFVWLLPAIAIEVAAQIAARTDFRKIDKVRQYIRWHTHGLKRPFTVTNFYLRLQW
ncbi:MAG: glycosyltransferase [Nitrososphaerota archaeon]